MCEDGKNGGAGGQDPPQQSPHVVRNTHSAAWRILDTMRCRNSEVFWDCLWNWPRVLLQGGILHFPTTLTLTSDLPRPTKNNTVAGLKVGPVTRSPEKSHADENINNSRKCYCPPGMEITIFKRTPSEWHESVISREPRAYLPTAST